MTRWHAIETAPTEWGERFLVWGPGWTSVLVGWRNDDDRVWAIDDFNEPVFPADNDYPATHWAELPDPPRAAARRTRRP
ncbi:hypothetical protein [Roseospira goensis]|uniref:DUF551 domain-containing protein n=1 Tax=Roseospira goensis TaxID=391922 RepID=A0A7W6S323_9PROT|nr:hypothetical protein [Roseospira goensis]MBB4287976.1 hypothetical protein [Roseospira goensis]